MPAGRKALVLAVAALAVAWALLQFLVDPWHRGLKDVDAKIQELRPKVEEARKKLADEPRVSAEWQAMAERLGQRRSDEAATRFNEFLDALAKENGLVGTRLTPDASRKQIAGKAFQEVAVELQFQCPWEALVKLLLAIHNTDEFVRVERFSVRSQYPKESRFDVNLRISTIALANGGGR